jgi:putative ABC transport system permease protein
MNLLDSFTVALVSLAANKLRSMLTMLGVIIGVGAVIAMISIAQGAKNQMMSNIQSLGTNVVMVHPGQQRVGGIMGGMGTAQRLTTKDVEAIIRSCDAVKTAAPESRRNSQVKFGNMNTTTTIIGTTPDYLEIRGFQVAEGRFFNNVEVKSKAKVCTVGQTVVTNLFGDESPLGKTLRINRVSFKVIGVMVPKGQQGWQDPDDQIFVPVTTAMNRIFKTEYINSISVEAVSMDRLDQASREIETLLRRRHRTPENEDSDFTVRTQAEFTQMAETAARTFMMLLGGIASVSLLVGGIGIMNIMLVSVTERTREIGIRKAVGARRRDILIQFLIESVVLSTIGGIIGILLGIGASRFIAVMAGWQAEVTIDSVLISFGFAGAIGVFFGIYPAQKAASLDPIEALRYE